MKGLAGGRVAVSVLLSLLLFIAALPQATAQEAVDDKKLEAFVAAVIKVDRLIDQWTPKIQNAENREEAAALNKQANDELKQAIEETDGISVPEYQQISQALRENPELLTRMQKAYKEQTAQ